MKNNFKYYLGVWAILLLVYNVVALLVQPLIPWNTVCYDARFWIAWGIVIATYLGQLFCAKQAFDAKNNDKFFLNVSLIRVSYTALIVTTLVATVLMLVPNCPVWIAAVLGVVVFGWSAVSVIKASAAANIVSEIDDNIKAQTSFIKVLTADAEALLSRAQGETAKAACKKVYEAVRYSDPMSNDALSGIEGEIAVNFSKFSHAVASDDLDSVTKMANELVFLLGDRNKKCRLLK